MPRKTRPPKGDGPKNYPWWLWNLKGPDYYRNKYPSTPIVQDPPIVNTTAPNPKILEATARVQREFLLNAAQAGMPEPYAYGHTVVKPLIVSADDTGANLILDLLWSAGEIEGFVEVAGDRFVYMPDIGYGIAEGSGFEHFTGAPGQSASTIMTALKGSYDTLAGKAHSVITMDLDWNLNLYGWIYGRKVTDPRVSPSFIYSENPALVLADVLSLCNYTLDWDSVGNAADYCDELIGSSSPQVPRWKLGGVIYDRHDLKYWVHTLAQYCSCFVDIQGSYVYLVPDKPRSSTHTVTAADMVDGSVRVRRKGARDVPSRVEVTYGYGATGRSIAGYGTASGPGTTTQLQMPFFRGLRGDSLAYRKGEEVYRKAQADLECEFISFDDGLLLTLGDVGTITNANYGLSSQDMILVENEIVDRGRWRRKYIEYEPTAYVDTEYTITLNNVSLYNPYDPPDGPEPTLTYIGFGEASPQTQSCIQIEFSPLTWAYLKQYYVTVTTTLDEETILYEEYINKGAETGSPLTITTQTDFAAALGESPQTVYRVNVYIVSIVDALSAIPGTADITDPVIPAVNCGLLAWWAFDESSGPRYNSHATVSPDPYTFQPTEYNYPGSPWAAGTGSVGSTTGVLTTSSPLALAAQIDTSSPADWLSCYFGASDGIATATSFTIAGWVKLDTVDITQGIMRKGDINNFADISAGDDWLLYYTKAGLTSPQTWSLRFIARTTGTDKTVTAAAPLVAGQWHYICCWFEETVGAGISLDGVTIGTSLITQSPAPPLEKRFNQIHAGLYQMPGFGPQFPLNGALDEWGFWNRKLTEEEITYLYNSGAGRAYTDLPTGECPFVTTAKWLGNGDSPSAFYRTGGYNLLSPHYYNSLVNDGTYESMTLVFCVHPNTFDNNNVSIFSSDAGNFNCGIWDSTGGFWLGRKDVNNIARNTGIIPSGSPLTGGLILGQWNTVMVAYEASSSTSPWTRRLRIWINGAEEYDGLWGANSHPQSNPMAYTGYVWAGLTDFAGVSDSSGTADYDGLDCYLSYVWCNSEYLDPDTYWSSFFDENNKPKYIGDDGSSVTGSAPYTFAPDGNLTINLGTGDNWDEIGTVPDAPSSPTD